MEDQNNQLNSATNTQNPNPSTDKPIGTIIAVVVVIVALLVGGYLLVNKKKAQVPQETVTAPSTEVSAIETDLDAIDLGDSAELEQLERAL